jgi:hypothetical protein
MVYTVWVVTAVSCCSWMTLNKIGKSKHFCCCCISRGYYKTDLSQDGKRKHTCKFLECFCCVKTSKSVLVVTIHGHLCSCSIKKAVTCLAQLVAILTPFYVIGLTRSLFIKHFVFIRLQNIRTWFHESYIVFVSRNTEQVGPSGNVFDSYSKDDRLQSQSGHYLSWLRFFRGFPKSLQGISGIIHNFRINVH